MKHLVLELLADAAVLGLFVACAYGVFGAYARRRRPQWTGPLVRRRLAVWGLLALAALAAKIVEDVLARESGPVDEAILWFLRGHVPAVWSGFFAAVTVTGSSMFLVPAALLASAGLLAARRRFEAVLLSGSSLLATAIVWTMKAAVGRARPALWEAPTYWGSSFPSGHTLSTAAFATAAALCVARIWPKAAGVAMLLAGTWACTVALSRLVLGVHWPSDVLAALCIGGFIPLLVSVAFDLRPGAAATRERAPGT